MGCHPLGVQEDVALISEIKTDGAGLTVNEEVASTFWNMFYTIILCIQVQYYQRSLLYQSLLNWAALNGTIGDKHRQALL